jgi:hypothetical protein
MERGEAGVREQEREEEWESRKDCMRKERWKNGFLFKHYS